MNANPARGGLDVFRTCRVGIRPAREPDVNRIHFPWEMVRGNRRAPSYVDQSGRGGAELRLELPEIGAPAVLTLSIHQTGNREHG